MEDLTNSQLQRGIKRETYYKDTYYIRCLCCGSLVHWSASQCENCLANPLQERRSSPRVKFQKTFMHDGLLATICNISAGGVQIKTRASLSTGHTLKMAFSLEDCLVRVHGTIVYSQTLSTGNLLAGVKFGGLFHKDAESLNQFLGSHERGLTFIPRPTRWDSLL